MRVEIRTGTEGPKHDPYGYQEITVHHRGRVIMLHAGLGEYLEIDGVRCHENNHAAARFAVEVGATPEDVEKWHERAKSRCCICGMREYRQERGYPGEMFTLCINRHIMKFSFNESAVL
jgi:hypothetical protein